METITIADGIAQVNSTFMKAIRRKDAAAAAACYSADGMVLAPQSEPVVGRKAIETFWNGFIKAGVTEVNLTTTEVIEAGNIASEVGRYLVMASRKELDHGKYVVVWKIESGEWKLHRDIWNTSAGA